MSQVIVTNDKLNEKRLNSRKQELNIKKEDKFTRWRRDDVTKSDALQRFIGLVVTPILALWAGLCLIIAAVGFVLQAIFKILGKLTGGRHSLITDP